MNGAMNNEQRKRYFSPVGKEGETDKGYDRYSVSDAQECCREKQAREAGNGGVWGRSLEGMPCLCGVLEICVRDWLVPGEVLSSHREE